MISIEDFRKLDLRVGKIVKAEKLQGSEKLLRLEVNLGEETRQLVAGIAKFYEPEILVGKEIIIVANLEHKEIMGLQSQGMLLAAEDKGQIVLLEPEKEVSPGAKIY